MTTIKDIASVAGVSHMTVSRALNNSPQIATSTKELILKIARELNYRPNYSAKSLVMAKSYTVGVFFSTIRHSTAPSFFQSCLLGIYHSLPKDYQLIIKDLSDGMDNLNLSRVDGVILVSQQESDNEFIEFVQEFNVPLVVLNRQVAGVMNVLVDEVSGAMAAVEYLLRNQRQRIAMLNGPGEIQSSIDRFNGYQQALGNAGIEFNSDYLSLDEFSVFGGYQAMRQLLQRDIVMPDAVFCANDEMAVGALRAIREAKLAIPEDIAVVGFNNSEISQFTNPPLTTVLKPNEEMARRGCHLLFDLIESRQVAQLNHKLNTELIVRESA